MAQGNWLSFSQYPLESSFRSYQPPSAVSLDNSSSDLYQQYLFNAFYGNEESNIPNSEENKQPQILDLSNLSPHFQTQVPKLEDFLSLASYPDTHTQDQSSLVGNAYDLNQITGFQRTNSGSEVEDSGSATGNRVESINNELMLCDNTSQSLSLGVGQNTDNLADTPKALVSDTFGQRTSVYRGVTRHRWTGRYEAHLWDNSCRREGQSRKGRQVYLGGYDKEDKAARAYDLAALKYWGPGATTNFPVTSYTQELEEMKNMTKQEFIASLRRKSSGFSRGASVYRGVTRHHQQGRWQARIGRVAGNKDLYLGTFGTEEEAAEAYDIAAIKFRGLNAVTNFEMNRYDVEAIANSALPIGAVAKRLKLSLDAEGVLPIPAHEFQQPQSCNSSTSSVVVHPNVSSGMSYGASMALYHQNLFQHYHPTAVCSSDSMPSAAVTSMAPLPHGEFPNRNFQYGFATTVNMDNHYGNNETNGNYLSWSMGSPSN